MKMSLKYMLWGILGMVFWTSCEDMNSLHEEYLNRGESIYTGVVDSLTAAPGNERVKFRWLLNSDPRITHVLIYWNDYADSMSVDVNRTQNGDMWMEDIYEFPENDYVFNVKTADDEGHRSMPTEISVKVYGANYIATLMNRGMKSREVNERGEGVISWLSPSTNTLLYTVVKYTDYSNLAQPEAREVRVENEDMETILPGVRNGDEIKVYSCFQPEESIDTFESKERSYTFN